MDVNPCFSKLLYRKFGIQLNGSLKTNWTLAEIPLPKGKIGILYREPFNRLVVEVQPQVDYGVHMVTKAYQMACDHEDSVYSIWHSPKLFIEDLRQLSLSTKFDPELV